jgi:hypothetical protein
MIRKSDALFTCSGGGGNIYDKIYIKEEQL